MMTTSTVLDQVDGQFSGLQSKSRLDIEPRRVKFAFEDVDEPFYFAGNTCISAMWAALSVSFPPGEAEFIKSVKLFEGRISDPKLLGEIKNFTHQEAHHSLQHRQINKQLEKLGYQVSQIEEVFKEELARRAEQWTPEKRLARTVVAEHVTAVMAHFALTHQEQMAPLPESFLKLFQWHSIEEIEHKSVAFDVYQQCVGDRKLLMKEFRAFLFHEFPLNTYGSARHLLKQMEAKVTWRDRFGLIRFLFGKQGMVRSMWSQYMMFKKPGFHPWDHDDSDLVEKWRVKLSPYFVSGH